MAEIPMCPRLSERHLANSRIVSDRTDLLPLFPKGGVVVEVGVALGDFSLKLIEVCRPDRFVAIDLFGVHHNPTLWGRPTSEIFGGRTHAAFYRDRMAEVLPAERLTILEGDSIEQLRTMADRSVDIFYVDADHTYASCSGELAVIKDKVKDDGLIVLNDYVMSDVMGDGKPYGVIQATHEFMIAEDWEMLYLALQGHMYCDVVIRKIREPAATQSASLFGKLLGRRDERGRALG